MLSEWEHWHPFDVQPTLNYICAKPIQLCHTTTSKAKLAGFATLPSFYSLLCVILSPASFSPTAHSPKYFVPIFIMGSALHCPVPLNQICPIFSFPPPLAELCWWYWVFGREHSGSAGICSKDWHTASHWTSLRQPESRCWIYLQPTCQLMLFVGVRGVGIASMAFALPSCLQEI